MAHWRPIAESLCCVFGQDTLISQSVSPPRVPANCTNNVQVPIFADSSLLFFFSSLNTLWFHNAAILGSRWVSGEEILITVLFALRCLVPHKFMHDVSHVGSLYFIPWKVKLSQAANYASINSKLIPTPPQAFELLKNFFSDRQLRWP